MRIASPPTRHSCFYGVDTPERAKLLAAQMSVAEMNDYIQRRQPRLRLDRRPLPRARRGAARRGRSRNIATPASPATIRPALTDQEELERRTSSRARGTNAWPDEPAGAFDGASLSAAASSPARAAASARRPPRRWPPTGAHVVLTARTAADLEAVEERIHAGRRQRDDRAARPDRERQHRPARRRRSAERWGALDMLVLNAAMLGSLTPVAQIDGKEFSRVLTLNVLRPARR